jgi:AcrR family transcriptional regulator
VRTRKPGAGAGERTFTRAKRRDQLVGCMIDAIAQAGFPRASVAEVARRAGVSKGVVTYHFPAKDDLIRAVIADVIGSMSGHMMACAVAADPHQFPERFLPAYIAAWVGYYRAHARDVLALVRIYNGFRDESGQPDPAFRSRDTEIARVADVLRHGQALGRLGPFDAGVLAAVLKAALDDLLAQFAEDPSLDLEAYGAEMTTLFERAARPQLTAARPPAPA